MTINSASVYPLFRDGVAAVIGNYNSYPDLYKQVFKTVKSHKRMEFATEFKSLAIGRKKPEGTSVAQDSMTVKYQKTYVHDTYGLSFSITDEAMNDNLYKDQFPQHLKALTTSLRAAKAQAAANVFNLGSTTELSVDGVPFFSENHPLENGEVVSNKSNVALSEVGIQNAIVGIQQFKQLSGILTQVMPKHMLVSPPNQFAASVLLGSQFRASTGTANNNALAGVNDINAINHDSYLPEGFLVDHYITSPTFAAICTDADRGLMHYERAKLSPWDWVDPTTKDLWFAASQRYVFGVTNWRCGFQIGE